MALPGIEDLSLLGLFGRIDHIEQLKEWKKTGEEDTAIIGSEAAVKKAIAGQLAEASGGFSNAETTKAKAFLQAQMKAIDPSDKHASARRDKLSQLLEGVENASSMDEPAHVKRARDALKRVKTEFKDINETYVKWEKGKVMFKTTDELKAMQKKHEDTQKCLEATESFIEEMLALRTSDARPPALPGGSSSAARPKGKAAATRAAADPSVRVGGGGGGYPSAKPRSTPAPSDGALRAAQMAASVRAEAEAVAWAAQSEAPKAARPPPRPKAVEEETVVLSYSCTCKAVSEILGISLDKAKDMAESSSEFKRHLRNDEWPLVKERSLAIEKEQKENDKLKEQRKKDSALARVSEKQVPTLAAVSTAPLPGAQRSVVPKAVGGKAKPAPQPKATQPKTKNITGLAHANRFAGMSDSDDDDGFTQVKR